MTGEAKLCPVAVARRGCDLADAHAGIRQDRLCFPAVARFREFLHESARTRAGSAGRLHPDDAVLVAAGSELASQEQATAAPAQAATLPRPDGHQQRKDFGGTPAGT